jgi:hypothetical protein
MMTPWETWNLLTYKEVLRRFDEVHLDDDHNGYYWGGYLAGLNPQQHRTGLVEEWLIGFDDARGDKELDQSR